MLAMQPESGLTARVCSTHAFIALAPFGPWSRTARWDRPRKNVGACAVRDWAEVKMPEMARTKPAEFASPLARWRTGVGDSEPDSGAFRKIANEFANETLSRAVTTAAVQPRQLRKSA